MAALTSLYPKNETRDKIIQSCIDRIILLNHKYPDNYAKYGLMEIFDTKGGNQPPKSEFIYNNKHGYIRFLQIRDFSSDNTKTYIPINNRNKICKKNDILIGRYGASVGKILTGKEGAYNVACAKLIINNESIIYPKFLFYLLHHSKIQNTLRGISRGAQGGFNKNDLSKINISIPKLKFQFKIVKILESIDKYLIDKVKLDEITDKNDYLLDIDKQLKLIIRKSKLITKSKKIIDHNKLLFPKLRQAILQEAIEGKLVPQDPNDEPASELLKRIKDEKEQLIAKKKIKKGKPLPPITDEEIPFEIPDGWQWCRMQNIFDIRDGTHDSPKYINHGIPLVTSKCFKNGKINFGLAKNISNEDHIKINKRSKVDKLDILFSMIGGNLGNMVMVNTDIEFSIKNVALFKYYKKEKILPYYLYIFLEFLSVIIQKKAGGGAQPFVSLKFLRNYLIPLPPLQEQKRIVAKVDELMQLCDQLEEQVNESKVNADMLMQAVLKEAFEA